MWLSCFHIFFSGRGYPDVAALGHNYYIQLNGEAIQVDGTSCSAPVFAGVVALLNAYRVENGKSKIGFANPLLYQIHANSPDAFNDITSGNNKCTEETCNGCTGFSAAPGWDATTGLGTPNYPKMIAALQELDGLASPSKTIEKMMTGLRGATQQ